jgi:hypothetical protein
MDVDFSESARRHFEDAGSLREGKRHPNADQLYGIAAECALKAIMVGLGAPTKPTGDLADPKHWKHLPELWAEFQAFPTGRAGARYLSVLPRDNPFDDWGVAQRYAPTASVKVPAVEAHFKATRAVLAALQRAAEDGIV